MRVFGHEENKDPLLSPTALLETPFCPAACMSLRFEVLGA